MERAAAQRHGAAPLPLTNPAQYGSFPPVNSSTAPERDDKRAVGN